MCTSINGLTGKDIQSIEFVIFMDESLYLNVDLSGLFSLNC